MAMPSSLSLVALLTTAILSADGSTVLVETVGELKAAILDASVSTIEISEAGSPYILDSTLDISRSVALRAAAGQRATLDGGGARRVMSIRAGAVSLTGLVLTRGRSSNGAGLYVRDSSSFGGLDPPVVTIADCVFSENVAAYNSAGGPCVGEPARGAGIYVDSGTSLTMTASQVKSNSGPPACNTGRPAEAFGIGLFVAGEASISNCAIKENAGSRADGGGLFVAGGAKVSMVSTTVVDNVANASMQSGFYSLGNGGGLAASVGFRFGAPNGQIVLSRCSVMRNRARQGGGINFNLQGGSIDLTDGTLVAQNVATNLGGGLVTHTGTALLRNGTLFEGNRAPAAASLMPLATTYYQLPAPPGFWLTSAECLVYRAPCFFPFTENACTDNARECSVLPGDPAFTRQGVQCEPTVLVQPCDWQTSPQLLGTRMLALPLSLAVEERYPYRCSVGFYGSRRVEDQGLPTCAGLCPPGRYCPEEATTTPLDCLPGHYCPPGTVIPEPCPPGTFGASVNLARRSECTRCPVGHACQLGATHASECEAGSTAPAGSDRCVRCARGTYQPESGQEVCLDCQAGHFCTPDAQIPCDADTYNPDERQASESACGKCPEATTTQGSRAATSVEACVCALGFYRDSSDTASTDPSCIRCTVGMNCTMFGTELVHLPVSLGYYRHSAVSIDVRACPDLGTGCSDLAGCADTHSGCAGGTDVASQCRAGLAGPFCTLCAADNTSSAIQVYYRATSTEVAHCEECPLSPTATAFTYLAIAAAIALCLAAVVVAAKRLPERRRATWVKAYHAYTVATKVRILVGFYQVTIRIPTIYEVTLPPSVTSWFGVLESILSLGFDNVDTGLSVSCIGVTGYVARVVFWTVFPLGIGLCILAAAALRHSYRRRTAAPEAGEGGVSVLTASTLLKANATPLLLLYFLVYPICTNVAFESLSCEIFDEGTVDETRWLRVDPSIGCGSAKHRLAVGWAVAAIVIYPVGLIVGNSVLLFTARRAITGKHGGKSTSFSRSIRFLYRDFRREFYYWEVCEMARRLVLVGLLIVFKPGSIEQLAVGTILALIYCVVQVQAAPYACISDNFLASVASLCLVAVLLCCTYYKFAALTEVPELVALMSVSQQRIYDIGYSQLTAGLFISIAATVFILGVIVFFIFTAERRRQQEASRHAKARRLRYLIDDAEVPGPQVGADEWSIFLSHVWSTGQDQMRIVKQRLVEMVPDLKVFLDVDDLQEIGDLEGYIDRSQHVLIFATSGYFQSRNCLRELLRSAFRRKPIIALLEPEARKGGLSQPQIRMELQGASDALASLGLMDELEEWGFAVPSVDDLFGALFAAAPIEWNRLGVFQDVTMRLLAERVLCIPTDQGGATYVQGEIANTQIQLAPPSPGRYHVYCSPNNFGAAEFLAEFAAATAADLAVTSDAGELTEARHFFLYLNGATWSSGEQSARLAGEIERAMSRGVHPLLLHEMPNVIGAADAEYDGTRRGCPFDQFFAQGATPLPLLKAGLYDEIAVPCKPGVWRGTSFVMFARALNSSSHVDEEDTLKKRRVFESFGPALAKVVSSRRSPAHKGEQAPVWIESVSEASYSCRPSHGPSAGAQAGGRNRGTEVEMQGQRSSGCGHRPARSQGEGQKHKTPAIQVHIQ